MHLFIDLWPPLRDAVGQFVQTISLYNNLKHFDKNLIFVGNIPRIKKNEEVSPSQSVRIYFYPGRNPKACRSRIWTREIENNGERNK